MKLNTRQEWLAHRNKGLGGSDAAAVLGINPWMSNVDLWQIKTGRKQQEDIGNKAVVKYGVQAEEYLRKLFVLDYPEYELSYEPHNSFTCPDTPFLLASLDGWLKNKITGEKGIWECKTTEIKRFSDLEKWNNQIPQYYYCQVLHYFNVLPDHTFCILKAQLKRRDNNGNVMLDTRHYFFNKKECQSDCEYLKEKEIEFWRNYVEKDVCPALILPEI